MSQQIASNSWYNDPIQIPSNGLVGYSRDWGNVSAEVRDEIINTVIASAKQAGLSDYDTGLLLSTIYTESGFNPSAAAKSTSAQGLGQMIDSTGSGYGLTEANQWDVQSQIDATIGYFQYSE